MAEEVNYTVFMHAPWGGATGEGDIVIWDANWAAGTFKWQIGDPSDLTIVKSLGNASAGSEGVSAVYDANYQHPTSGAQGPATIITPQIDEATLEGAAIAALFDGINDLVLPYTFYLTPPVATGLPERVHQFGTMTVKKGVADA